MIVAASFDLNNPENWLNRGLQYGDGLFETMRVHKAAVPLLDIHLTRLNQSVDKLDLQAIDRSTIDSAVLKLDQKYAQSCVFKLTVFRAHQERTYQPLTNQTEWVITAHPLLMGQTTANAVTLGVAETKLTRNKVLAGMKHLSRIEQVVIANELNTKSELDDLLVVDTKNKIIETTHQNIVLIKDYQLFTPKLNNCGVYGVGLRWLESNFKVKAKHIKLNDLNKYDALLVGNSVRGFKTVSAIQISQLKQTISFAKTHPIQDKINQLWDDLFI